LSELFESNNPDVVRTIVQVLKKGKPLGIHLIMKHTRTDVNIRFEWLQMMQTRISFRDEKSNIIEGSETLTDGNDIDRKSTRLNSSHVSISYAVFCLNKKKYVASLFHRTWNDVECCNYCSS